MARQGEARRGEQQRSSSGSGRRRCWSAPGSDSISVCNNFSTVLHISLSTSCYNVFPVCAQRSKSGYERSYLTASPSLSLPLYSIRKCASLLVFLFFCIFLRLFEEVAPLATHTVEHSHSSTHTLGQSCPAYGNAVAPLSLRAAKKYMTSSSAAT